MILELEHVYKDYMQGKMEMHIFFIMAKMISSR